MTEAARDNTDEWLLPARQLPTVADLQERVEEAVVIARASEAAAIAIGDAAIESAEQARRAADLAERASRQAFHDGSAARSAPAPGGFDPTWVADASLDRFLRRADSVRERLIRLQG